MRMPKWIVLGLALAAACGGGTGPHDLEDALPASDASSVCNVLTQTGCPADERCTWVRSTDPSGTSPGLGAIACAPKGTIAIGGACTTAKVAMGGIDDCVGGSVCVTGTCKSICDNNGGAPGCSTNQACVTYDGLFANSGQQAPAGVCDPGCNPLDDNDFDGSGSAHTRAGSACGSDTTMGCYGIPSSTTVTHFTCAHPATGTASLRHRSVVPVSSQFLNSCGTGYTIAFGTDAFGSTNVDCYAFCKPGDSYQGLAGTQAPNGVSPHGCNTTDAVGNFGAIPTAVTNGTNGEHCMYSWLFELDGSGNLLASPTDNTVGICWDHSKYRYDSNGDNTVTATDAIIPACTTLPLTSTTGAVTAVDFGCVSTTTGGVMFAGKPKPLRRILTNLPEFPALSKLAKP